MLPLLPETLALDSALTENRPLSICCWPDPFLKLIATPVEKFGEPVLSLGARMIALAMEQPQWHADGLAATQVQVPSRLFVLGAIHGAPLVCANPELMLSEEKIQVDEHCSSLPLFGNCPTERSIEVVMRFQDWLGESKLMHFTGPSAITVQHMVDHLDGIMLFDPRRAIQKVGHQLRHWVRRREQFR